MSDDTEADIVLQLDALATYAERANHWTDDKRLMDAAGVADTVFGAIHRIEELEAKLAKAVGALGDIHNGEPEWPDDPQRELDWCRNRAGTTLAELKGQDDEVNKNY